MYGISSFSPCKLCCLFGAVNKFIPRVLKVIRLIVLVLFLDLEILINVNNLKTFVAFLSFLLGFLWIYFLNRDLFIYKPTDQANDQKYNINEQD